MRWTKAKKGRAFMKKVCPTSWMTATAVAVVLTTAPCWVQGGDLTADNVTVRGKLLVTSDLGLSGSGVVHYSFADNTVPVVDSSGKGHTGTVVGATWTTNGIWGGAYSFDGNDLIRVNSPVYPDGTVTFSMFTWVKFNAFVTDTRIMTFGNWQQTGKAYQLFVASSGWRFGFDLPNSGGPRSSIVVTTNVWYHVGVVCSNRTAQLYVNGITNSGTTYFSSMAYANSGGVQNLGGLGVGELNGTMDEVRLYDVALTTSQVFQLYQSNTVTFTVPPDAGVCVAEEARFTRGIAQTNVTATNVFMGAVGIGTNQPSTRLDVNGDATVRGALIINGTISGSGSGLSSLNASNLLSGIVPSDRLSGHYGISVNSADSADSAATADLAGNSTLFGGKTPGSYLQTDGSEPWMGDENGGGRKSTNWNELAAATISVGTGLNFGNSGSVSAQEALWLTVYTNQPSFYPRFRLGSDYSTWLAVHDDNVGVGTSQPQAKFHVNGSSRFQGDMLVEMGSLTVSSANVMLSLGVTGQVDLASGIVYHPPLGNLSMGVYTNR
jgi:hypothetical protein